MRELIFPARKPIGLLVIWLGTLMARAAELSAPFADGDRETPFLAESEAVESVSASLEAPKNEWLFAPIPSLNPGQGFGLQTVVARLFKPARAIASTPTSMLGLGVLYTAEKSYALGLGYQGYLDDDRWRVKAAGGFIRYNSDYYGTNNSLDELGLSIPLEQTAVLGLVQVTHRLRSSLYAGLRIMTANTEVLVHLPQLVLPSQQIQLPDLALKAGLYSAGPVVQWDTRDNTFAPTKGVLVNGRLDFFSGDYRYNSARLAVNHYRILGPGVLALRGYVQSVDGNAPFFALASFGGTDLRGYINGKYRDHAMLAFQAEYRWSLNERWGVVAFAGAGQVAHTFGSLSTDRLLGSVGGGIRYRLTKENPVNFRCDCAWGRDGGTIYFGVGEAY